MELDEERTIAYDEDGNPFSKRWGGGRNVTIRVARRQQRVKSEQVQDDEDPSRHGNSLALVERERGMGAVCRAVW